MADPKLSTDLAGQLAQAAREINSPASLRETLQRIVDVTTTSLLPEIDAVGLTLVSRGGQLSTAAASGDIVLELDRLQYESQEGPCLQAIHDCDLVYVPDLRHEQRWPAFVPGAARMGLRAQLGICLHTDGNALGGLNLYSLSGDTISVETRRVAELFAAHAALALGATQQMDNLTQALATREVIGQAVGILMGRLNITMDAAFSYLTRISSATQTKVRVVAQDVIDDHLANHVGG